MLNIPTIVCVARGDEAVAGFLVVANCIYPGLGWQTSPIPLELNASIRGDRKTYAPERTLVDIVTQQQAPASDRVLLLTKRLVLVLVIGSQG